MKQFAIGLEWKAAALLCAAISATAAEPNKPALPIKEITLYSSGTAMFERAGSVQGKAAIEFKFKTEDINDLLKSMVVQGGAVTSVTYDSRDPITKTLRSFGVDLTDNPGMGDLLNQLRGEKVTVFWPNMLSGTILGVETREQVVRKGDEEKLQEVEYLNLFGAEGLSSIPLSQIQKLQIENPQLQAELRQALEVLAGAHDAQKKSVTVSFDGENQRDVRVSYIAEAPVWKTSYRLVLDEEAPFLQGWAIVENTSDEDWDNVRLSLVSGRPISFVMDLYQPLYAPRPTVKPELYLSLRPQTYSDTVEEKLAEPAMAAAPPVAAESRMGMAAKAGRGVRTLNMLDTAAVAGDSLSFNKIDFAGTASAQGQVTGELFQYVVGVPVSIPRQKSAMLPIVSEKVAGQKLSIYNASVQAKHPLNGYRLTNSTALHLMQGPITVFDDGAYAGDARIEDIAPGQDRLISYALDLKVEVEPQSQPQAWELIKVRIKQGTFFATKQFVEETVYNIRNRDQKEKQIIIEHPFRADWDLESPSASERARDVYRFTRTLAPGKSDQIKVREQKSIVEEAYATTLRADSYAFYLRSPKVSEAIKEVLRKIQNSQKEISELAERRSRHERRINEISQEQGRIRENMARLAQNSELYNRYVKKFGEQESELEKLRAEIEGLKDNEAQLLKKLNDYLHTIELE